VTIDAFFHASGNHVLEISDNGPGIPDNEKSLVFEPFYRSPRHISVRGTGIGLSLVKSILELHRITVRIGDKKDGGAVFILSFQ
jgi:signal transduction histidine kinase